MKPKSIGQTKPVYASLAGKPLFVANYKKEEVVSMTRLLITKSELEGNYAFPEVHFPKYTSQLINWANQNAQGTRPRVVGQMSDLFPAYREDAEEHSIEEWADWYFERHPDAIENATDKIEYQIENLKEAIQLIDRNMIRDWVYDLVINKTYIGLYYQQVILSRLAQEQSCSWRLATPNEESCGIDGFVGGTPYSVKPDTYKTMNRLQEQIDVTMIYYKVKANGDLNIEVCD